jgi:hypothetical protein
MMNDFEEIKEKYNFIVDEMPGYDARLVLFAGDGEAVLFADNYDVEETFHVMGVDNIGEFRRMVTGLKCSGCRHLIYEEEI